MLTLSTPLAMLGPSGPARGSAPLRGWPAARGLTAVARDGHAIGMVGTKERPFCSDRTKELREQVFLI